MQIHNKAQPSWLRDFVLILSIEVEVTACVLASYLSLFSILSIEKKEEKRGRKKPNRSISNQSINQSRRKPNQTKPNQPSPLSPLTWTHFNTCSEYLPRQPTLVHLLKEEGAGKLPILPGWKLRPVFSLQKSQNQNCVIFITPLDWLTDWLPLWPFTTVCHWCRPDLIYLPVMFTVSLSPLLSLILYQYLVLADNKDQKKPPQSIPAPFYQTN